jgi:hypothetical protein
VAFWVYLCGEAAALRPPQEGAAASERTQAGCARAVHLARREVGLVWSPAREEEVSRLPASTPSALAGERVYHWVELLWEGAVVDRQLAVWLGDASASLPAPLAEPRGEGREPLLWVSGRAYLLVRLANEVDPECSDFDGCFARSGIELR